MENISKLRVSKDYDRLTDEIKELIKLVYPTGYSQHLLKFPGKEGKMIQALRFETDETIFLVRMTFGRAKSIVEDDEDFDDNGHLREDVREDYEVKYAHIEYLSENENYDA